MKEQVTSSERGFYSRKLIQVLSSDYRAILRQNGCLQALLQQLRSPSLTVVSNACGTLWNLSARCKEDQKVKRIP